MPGIEQYPRFYLGVIVDDGDIKTELVGLAQNFEAAQKFRNGGSLVVRRDQNHRSHRDLTIRKKMGKSMDRKRKSAGPNPPKLLAIVLDVFDLTSPNNPAETFS